MARRFLPVGAVALALVRWSAASKVTPLEKVVTLIEDLKAEIEAEGKTEAKTYDEFACFCKEKTMSLSDSIVIFGNEIGKLSSRIEADTAHKSDNAQQLLDAKRTAEELSATLATETARCEKEHAEFSAAESDLSQAISSLEGAIQVLHELRPAAGLVAMRQSVTKSVALAEALKIIDDGPRWTKALSFLQDSDGVNPNDPEYAFHSTGLIAMLDRLLGEFQTKKTDLVAEWGKARDACEDMKVGTAHSQKQTNDMIVLFEDQVTELTSRIGKNRGDLVQAQVELKDNDLYMKDLTRMCEERAKSWDQRSSQRADELKALSEALTLLKGKAAENEEVNERALIQRDAGARRLAEVRSATPDASAAAPSLLQTARIGAKSRVRLARGGRGLPLSAADGLTVSDRQARALAMLQQEGTRLGSRVLSTLAARMAADPFAKVKDLLQDLVERLLKEANEEATKNGFCNTEMSKATKERTSREQEASKLNGKIQSLEAKEEVLSVEIDELADAIRALELDFKQASSIRQSENKDNLKAISRAKEGFKAVAEAILILKSFYSQASQAAALVQTKASPVDADTTGPGFDGAYKGKQEASEGILGILEVLKSDFQRTVELTTQEEEEAHKAFTEYEQASKADIAGKTTKKDLDIEDRETVRRTHDVRMNDLKRAQDLLDSTLKRIEVLKPTCVDTGMSYEERAAKREQEMDALKRALCILDVVNAEPTCYD